MQVKAVHVIIIITVIILASGASVWLFYELPEREEEECPCSVSRVFEGSFYVNHAGEPTSDLPCYAEFNVTLVVQNSSGLIEFTRTGGALNVTLTTVPLHCLCQSSEELTFTIVTGLKLVWDSEDTVWNGEYKDHYIASYGFAAPQAERGSIWEGNFPGLHSHYYVELRLK